MSPFGLPGGGGPVEQIGVEVVAKTGKFLKQVDSAVSKGQGKLKGVIGKVGKAMAAGAAIGGVALAGLGAAAVKMGIDFEKSIAEVRTLIPQLSEEGFNKLRDDVLALSSEMGIATDELVPALYQAISAGVPPENVIDFLRVGAKASIGGVTDLTTAIDGLTTITNAWGLESDKAGEVADVMFTGVKLGKTTMGELSDSMFQAAPLAAALGISVQEVVAATATLTKSGVPTSVAMTQMRQAMVALTKPTADMTELLEKTGFESGEALIKAKGFTGALNVLTEAADGNKEIMGKAFGSVEALGFVLGVTGDNAKVAAEDLAVVTDSAGAADEAFETMDKTVSRKLAKSMNKIRVAMTRVGIKALPLMASGLDFIMDNMPMVIAAFGSLQSTLKAIGRNKDVQEFAAIIKETAEDVLPVMVDILEALTDGWKVLAKKVLKPFVLPILKVIATWLLEHKRVVLLVAAVLTFGLLPALVVVLAKWKEISQFLSVTIPGAIRSVIASVRGIPIIGDIFTATMETIRLAVETVVAWLILHFEFLLDTITNTFKFWKAIFSGEWGEAWEAVKDQAEAIWNLLSGLFGLAIDAIVGQWRTKLALIKGIGITLGNLIVDAAVAIWNGLWSLFGLAIDKIPEIWASRGEIAMAVGTKLGDLIADAAVAVWNGLTALFGEAISAISDVWKNKEEIAKGIGATLATLITEGAKTIWAFMGWAMMTVLFEVIPAAISASWNWLKDQGRQIARAIAQGMAEELGGALPFIGGPALFGPFVGRQHGGPVAAGQLVRINETGIEFFRPFSSGTVLPIAPAGGMAAGGSRLTNYGRIINIYGPGRKSTDVIRDLDRMVK